MKVIILGGDGYLGWPTAMYLAAKGHDICVVDNYMRRDLCRNHNIEPLFPVPNLHERVSLWESISGQKINIHIGDCCNYEFLCGIFSSFKPDTVIHYAEQPSAPYSMMNHKTALLTINNNLQSTLNTAWAVREHAPEAHIVKLGTMGEYGTPNIDIEEGWLDIQHNGRKDTFLFPRQASSLYHTTKIQDTDLLWFYVRMWGLRVTDLMQGPVYGLETEQTILDTRLNTIFNYDELFGTVVNRFVVQAVTGYPLTVYGKGGQTRGYLDLRDTIACVELSMLNPPDPGSLNIFNQVTETFSVSQLADMISKVGKKRGHDVQIKSIENPRKELEDHYYNPSYSGLTELGLTPHLLTDETLDRMFQIVESYKDEIQAHKIFNGVKW